MIYIICVAIYMISMISFCIRYSIAGVVVVIRNAIVVNFIKLIVVFEF